MALHDFPDHPLDLNKLVTLPPSEWRISRCGDDVVIGAWIAPYDNKIVKRLFKLDPRPTVESPDHPEKS